MKILLTGATGYIGKRLLSILVEEGHEVICCVRDLNRFDPPASLKQRNLNRKIYTVPIMTPRLSSY